MPRGGKRKGAGRKHSPIKKKRYGTRLRPDQIKWLKKQKNAAMEIEIAIDFYIKSKKERDDFYSCNWGTEINIDFSELGDGKPCVAESLDKVGYDPFNGIDNE